MSKPDPQENSVTKLVVKFTTAVTCGNFETRAIVALTVLWIAGSLSFPARA